MVGLRAGLVVPETCDALSAVPRRLCKSNAVGLEGARFRVRAADNVGILADLSSSRRGGSRAGARAEPWVRVYRGRACDVQRECWRAEPSGSLGG